MRVSDWLMLKADSALLLYTLSLYISPFSTFMFSPVLSRTQCGKGVPGRSFPSYMSGEMFPGWDVSSLSCFVPSQNLFIVPGVHLFDLNEAPLVGICVQGALGCAGLTRVPESTLSVQSPFSGYECDERKCDLIILNHHQLGLQAISGLVSGYPCLSQCSVHPSVAVPAPTFYGRTCAEDQQHRILRYVPLNFASVFTAM